MGTGDSLAIHIYALAGALLAGTTALAEPYRWELGGDIRTSEQSSDTQVDSATFDATWYYHPVEDSAGPLSLAPFLSRSSHISGRAERTEQSITTRYSLGIIGPSFIVTSKRASESYAVDGRKIWRESGWYVGGSLERPDSWEARDTQIDAYSVGLSGGKYIGRTTTISLNVRSAKTEVTGPVGIYDCISNSCFYGLYFPTLPSFRKSTTETDQSTLSVFHVGGWDGLRFSVSGSVSQQDTKLTTEMLPLDWTPANLPPAGGVGAWVSTAPVTVRTPKVESYEINGALYPTERIEVRLGFSTLDDIVDSDRLALGTRWFFRQGVAIEFAIARTDIDYPTFEANFDEARIRLLGRF